MPSYSTTPSVLQDADVDHYRRIVHQYIDRLQTNHASITTTGLAIEFPNHLSLESLVGKLRAYRTFPNQEESDLLYRYMPKESLANRACHIAFGRYSDTRKLHEPQAFAEVCDRRITR